MLTQGDLDSLRNVEGDMNTAVLFEGCDKLPEFARFTRALEKQRLVDTYGSIKTRLAENIAGVWCASPFALACAPSAEPRSSNLTLSIRCFPTRHCLLVSSQPHAPLHVQGSRQWTQEV